MPNNFPEFGHPNVINSGNDNSDAILTFNTGNRNYKWRLKAHGSTDGAKFDVQYYAGPKEGWINAQSWGEYKNAEGGDKYKSIEPEPID